MPNDQERAETIMSMLTLWPAWPNEKILDAMRRSIAVLLDQHHGGLPTDDHV